MRLTDADAHRRGGRWADGGEGRGLARGGRATYPGRGSSSGGGASAESVHAAALASAGQLAKVGALMRPQRREALAQVQVPERDGDHSGAILQDSLLRGAPLVLFDLTVTRHQQAAQLGLAQHVGDHSRDALVQDRDELRVEKRTAEHNCAQSKPSKHTRTRGSEKQRYH